MTDIFIIIGLALITYLAFWQKDMMIYFISAIMMVTLAARWMGEYPAVTIGLWWLAGYQVYLAIMCIWDGSGSARGYSWFKELYSRAKGGHNEE